MRRAYSLIRAEICFLVFLLLWAARSSAASVPGTQLDFVAVRSGDDYEKADRKLLQRLEQQAQVEFVNKEWQAYGDAIRKLVEWQESGFYLARMTPYAYVAAEMLGADFEVLAVYLSKATGKTTYHSYFVVRKDDLGERPGLEDVLAHLRKAKRRFVYHDKFSTSNYFLPSLYFRSQRIFAVQGQSTDLAAIEVTQAGKSSSFLVQEVAAGNADLAAVWDDTKVSYEKSKKAEAAEGSEVAFIQLPTPLPNDLLVCSKRLPEEAKQRIRRAIREMAKTPEPIGIGDFRGWEDIQESEKAFVAREALAALRRAAAAAPAPVTVCIRGKGQTPEQYLEAARQAVRLSGTEFVLYDKDFHGHLDVLWTVELIHDGAVRLTSDIRGSGLESQTFYISFDFENVERDLTKRIGALIHGRMHRIRYIWPYEEKEPTVIRDVDFALRENAPVRVRKILWKNPEKNDFDPGSFEPARIASDSDFHKFRLAGYNFPKTADQTALAFDPMNNEAYQVILVRPSNERLVFKALTAGFIGLLLLAATGAVIDVRRKPKPKAGLLPPEGLFEQTCREIGEEYHARWRQKRITETHLFWCDRARIDELIEELKTGGLKPEFDAVTRQQRRWGFLLKLPYLTDFVQGSAETSRMRELTTDPRRVGNAARVASLVPFLIEKRQLSLLTGSPLEWEALDRIARWIFQPAADSGTPVSRGQALLRPDDPMLLRVASAHFSKSLDEGLHQVSLFAQTWQISEEEDKYLLTSTVDLPGEIQVGTEKVAGLTMEFRLPRNAELQESVSTGKVELWLLGRIRRKSFVSHAGRPYLYLRFRALAVLRG